MTQKRIAELDGLRGLAALAVVFFHYFYHYDEIYGHDFEVLNFLRLGHYGVHLFFMVSGFVIFWTVSIVNHPFDFIWSRFTRLYPVYWAAAIITFSFVLIFTLPNREVSWIEFLINLTMLQEFFQIKHVDGSYWTLTLELAFYFWIFLLFSFKQLNNIEKWLSMWIITATVFSFPEFKPYINIIISKFLLLEYIQFFAAGICFFKIWTKQHNKKTYFLFSLCILSSYLQYSLAGLISLCSIHLIFYLAIAGHLNILRAPVLVFLGSISYSLYLVHQNIGYIIINVFYEYDLPSLYGIASTFILTIALACLLTFYVEKPSLNYLRKLRKKT